MLQLIAVLAGGLVGTMVWEDIDPATVPTPAANSNTIFLNRCTGGCTVRQGATDSRADQSSIPEAGIVTLGALSADDATWNDIVSCMRDVFAPVNVEIVTDDPGTAPHFEIMFGGQPGQMGLGERTAGVSPYNCGVAYIPNSLVFVFDVFESAEDFCSTASQELAHSFRLDHVVEPSDPMSYAPYAGRRYFHDAALQCGSDCVDGKSAFGLPCAGQAHACYTQCAGPYPQTQNPVKVMRALFGTGAPTPPIMTITRPEDGAAVQPGFGVVAQISDDNGVELVELKIDGAVVATRTASGIYVFNAPSDIAEGAHVVEIVAHDRLGAATTRTLDVTVTPPCLVDADCATPTDVCLAGRCVAGPDAAGGLGHACTDSAECESGACAIDGGGIAHCVEGCELGRGQCPDNFGCLPSGDDMGVCWPGYDDGTGDTGCNAAPGGQLALALGLAGFLARRRRRC